MLQVHMISIVLFQHVLGTNKPKQILLQRGRGVTDRGKNGPKEVLRGFQRFSEVSRDI